MSALLQLNQNIFVHWIARISIPTDRPCDHISRRLSVLKWIRKGEDARGCARTADGWSASQAKNNNRTCQPWYCFSC